MVVRVRWRGWGGLRGFFVVMLLMFRGGSFLSVDCALSNAIDGVLEGKGVKYLGLNKDVSDGRTKVAFAGGEQSFAFGTC